MAIELSKGEPLFTHRHAHTLTHTYTHTHKHTHIHTCTHMYTHENTHSLPHNYTHVYNKHTSIHTYTIAQAHTHSQTHFCGRSCKVKWNTTLRWEQKSLSKFYSRNPVLIFFYKFLINLIFVRRWCIQSWQRTGIYKIATSCFYK